MAIKAKDTITLSFMVDIKSVCRYYKLQASTASAPSVPTTNPPSGWTTTEPSYTSGSANTLYFVDLTVFTNDKFSYSAVSKSSSYEAAKEAYNKAVAAGDAAESAQSDIGKTRAEITKTEEEIRVDFNTAIYAASSDLNDKMDTNAEDFNKQIGEYNKYIRFVDGKIVLGASDNPLTLNVQNDRISFSQNGVETAYFSDNKFYIKKAETLTSLKIGNYEFSPRIDGGLVLRKVGL